MKQLFIFFLLLGSFSWSCRKSSSQQLPFEENPLMFPIADGIIDEASGLADSYMNPGHLWVNEDSHKPTALHLVSYTGNIIKKVFIKNVVNRDWEESAISDGPVAGKKYMYLADIGDNNQIYADYNIYRFEEPLATNDTVFQVDKINFQYPDGPHDAEAFFIDHATKDFYIITKRDAKSKIYRLTYPQSTTSMNIASFVMDLPYSGVVGVAFSPLKNELLIKTYPNIYYYKIVNGQPLTEPLKGPLVSLPYNAEVQGESICFANDNSGFYTLSEKVISNVSLRFYKRR